MHHHCDVERCVDALLRYLGHDIRLGVPLGLGKPVALVNALYARAKADPTLRLTLLTALSLTRPVPGNAVERAFLAPFIERVFGDAPELDYVADQRGGTVPVNVSIREFFFAPASQLSNARAQQDYICTNYTFAARDVFAQGCNAAAQTVASEEGSDGPRYSLSSNPDTGPELIALLKQAQAAGKVEADWQVPEQARGNTPERLAQRMRALRQRGLFPDFPFGHDFTDIELDLARALPKVKAVASQTPKWKLVLKALRGGPIPDAVQPHLARMNLQQPGSLQDRVVQRLLIESLHAARSGHITP